MNTKLAVGVIRVSRVGKREGDSFASPETQRTAIQAACKREGLRLITIHEEMDVSGGKPLNKRPGLLKAVTAIEDGEAHVIAGAYFDRLFRSLQTQAEVVERVERAGGQVFAVDVGHVTNGTAGQWLSAGMLGLVAEYHRRVTKERIGDAQVRAVNRGVVPYPGVTPGYIRTPKGKFTKHPVKAPIVAEAFQMRADGAPIRVVREYLADNGIALSYAGTARFLSSRVVLGEIHFGTLTNLEAHDPIVDRAVWQKVQRISIPRGRNNKSDRLLARLGVLRCGTCGAKMIVGKTTQHFYTYRCPPTGDCAQRVTISANLVESVAVDKVHEATHGVYGLTDRVAANARGAQTTLALAEKNYEAAMAVLSDFTDDIAVAKLKALKVDVANAQQRVDRIGYPRKLRISFKDWDELTLDKQREYIAALIERIDVHPGRGKDRLVVKMIPLDDDD